MKSVPELINQNRAGQQAGLPCFCTANEQVIRAALKYAKRFDVPCVIEATCNQVNQDGGYTGLRAADFAQWIASLTKEYGLEPDNIILGGDHLGPNPWRAQPVDAAMQKAAQLVKDYAAAGFKKIHLDASMACGDEPTPSFEAVAQRAATLCKIAETHSPHPDELMYIIGTEVPIPGGETDDMSALSVTSDEHFYKTIETHKNAFDHAGLSHVWPKIVSVVTQPGVDFSHTAIHEFESSKATHLANAVKSVNNMTFEAHSTDYQPTSALSELVKHHFFFLKVGPELTFRMREAVFALAKIETHLLEANEQSDLVSSIDKAMQDTPEHWSPYYSGSKKEVAQLKRFSYSDRIRYYWATPAVKTALDKLMLNLQNTTIPETLVSQYFSAKDFGTLNANAVQLLDEHIERCIDRYYRACGFGA